MVPRSHQDDATCPEDQGGPAPVVGLEQQRAAAGVEKPPDEVLKVLVHQPFD
jgi:hypothetical protein